MDIKDFTSVLIINNIISEQELSNLINLYNDNFFEIINHLIKEGVVDRLYLGKLCGDYLEIAYTDLQKVIFQPDLIKKFPEEIARNYKIIPLYQFGNTITIVSADPKNLFVLDKVEKTLKCQVSALFSFPDEIDEAIEEHYSKNMTLINSMEENINNSEINNEDNISGRNIASQKPIFSSESQKFLINNSKEIINDAFNGKIPSASTSDKIRNLIIDEVHNKIDVIYGFHQLRIKDEYTYSHCINVAALTAIMGKFLGLDLDTIKNLTLGALLHDIGKMRIPKVILYKPGKLNPDELEIAKRHPQLGYQVIKMMELPEKVADIALNHHERIDGNGYPRKLKGDGVPFSSQVISIADIYDNLVSDKPYGVALDHHEALNIMLLEGSQVFNDTLLRKFVDIAYRQNYESLKKKFKDSVYGEII